jgi:cobalt transporter subunit CbtA
MISRVLTAACVAGFLTAVVVTILQVFATTPLILKAETFEKQASVKTPGKEVLALAHTHQAPALDAQSTDADHAEWQPTEGLARAAFTGLATLVSGVGYALLLAALLLAAGSDLSIGQTLTWAIGGFLAVNLAPAAGCRPSCPAWVGSNSPPGNSGGSRR